MTPLGPGGAPFARWRPIPLLLGAGVAVPTVLLMLSDRAPGWLDRFTERLASTSPGATQALRDSPLPDAPFLVHVLVWAAAATLVVLIAWSWPSVSVGLVLVVVAGLVVEAAQDLFSRTRNAELRDVVANVVGVGVGTVLGLGIWAMIAALDRRRAEPGREQVPADRRGV